MIIEVEHTLWDLPKYITVCNFPRYKEIKVCNYQNDNQTPLYYQIGVWHVEYKTNIK
jgi:hypothetical protein